MLRSSAFVLTLLALLPSLAGAGPAPYSTLYLYGDSLTDTGNSLFLTQSATPPSPNPIYYPNTGHYTDGATYGELLWQGLGLPGDLAPRFSPTGGTNYAVGGARSRYGSAQLVDDATSGLRLPPALADMPDASSPAVGSFLAQVDLYLQDSGGSADPFALYLVWMGSNDVRDIATLASPASPRPQEAPGLFAQSIGDLVDGILALIAAGARNVAVPSVSDLGRTPNALALDAVVPGTATALSQAAAAYNAALAGTLDTALSGLTGLDDLDLWYIDTFGRLGEVLDDPASYGIEEVAEPCLTGYFVDAPTGGPIELCIDPQVRAFYDAVHPASPVHVALANDMLAVVPAPPTFLLMIGVLGLLAYQRRATRGLADHAFSA